MHAQATANYLNMEKTINVNENAIVFVSANSIKSLKKVYPSYFFDISEFVAALERINLNCRE